MHLKKKLFDSSLKSGIYKITCKKPGAEKHYIGYSSHVVRRLNTHKNKLRRKIHECKQLQTDFHNYGENLFIFERLLIGTGENKKRLEELETTILLTLPEELRYNYNMYTNWRLRNSFINPFFGKVHSREAREAQREAKKNKPSSFKNHTQKNEVKQLLSQQNKGQTSVERRKALYINSVYYESISEASALTGLGRRLIRERCHSTEERWNNYQWAEKKPS